MTRNKIILFIITGFIILFCIISFIWIIIQPIIGKIKYNINIPSIVNNILDTGYTKIPNTQILLKLSDDFLINNNSNKIVKDENNYIYVLEMPNTNFCKAKLAYTKDSLIKQGIKIEYYKELKVNSEDCIFYIANEGKNKNCVGLVFGDDTYFAAIYGDYEKRFSIEETKLINCLLSIYRDTTIVNDIEKNAKFEIDLENSDFKFHSYTSLIYIYKENGIRDTSNIYQPTINLGYFPTVYEFNEDYSKNYVLEISEKYKSAFGIPNLHIIEQKDTLISNEKSYKIIVKGNDNNKDIYFLIVVMANKELTIFFAGFASDNYQKYINHYNDLIKTLKMKYR